MFPSQHVSVPQQLLFDHVACKLPVCACIPDTLLLAELQLDRATTSTSSSSNGVLSAQQQQQQHLSSTAAASLNGSSNGAAGNGTYTYDDDTVEGIQMNPQKTIAAGLSVRVSVGFRLWLCCGFETGCMLHVGTRGARSKTGVVASTQASSSRNAPQGWPADTTPCALCVDSMLDLSLWRLELLRKHTDTLSCTLTRTPSQHPHQHHLVRCATC